MTSLVPTRPRTITIHWVTPEALPKFHMWLQLMISLTRPNSSRNIHASAGYAEGAAQISQANTIKNKSCPCLTTSIHDSSGYTRGAAQISHVSAINGKSRPNSTINIHNSSGYAGGAAQIPHVNSINVNAISGKSCFVHKHPQFYYSGYAGGAVQIPHVNAINGKSRPNSTTNIHDSSGYAGGAAQIPHVNTINDKSRPNSTTNIHDSSGYAGGAAQIPHVNSINVNAINGKSCFVHKHFTILQVTPEALPKLHMWTQLIAILVLIRPQTSTILQVTLHKHPRFFRLHRRRCPNSTCEHN